uniref:protein-tyrosine-phosphatase n=1 Tax=Rousettus aegyptiacus TaxID=9407 RepID=A0A7J8GE61_ROUAE|nr:protein tyrosine phosphatase receptor type E [Rousettus aegyptiacus]
MVWEQKSTTIVMLTNLKERKEEKCYQYWPDQGCWTYGSVRVCVEDCVVLVDYTVRKFCIQALPDGCKAPRLVSQLHFTSWPDFGVPFTPIGMLKFLKKVKTLNPVHAGPIVVHCSAGVGRTGTFIVIDAMVDMMHAEQKVDVFEFVSRIRSQRPQMVQTDMQYSFIYQALLEHYLYGDTELDVSSLERHLQTLQGSAARFDKIGLEEEFRARVVRQFHFHGWPEVGIPAEGKGMLDLIGAVQKQQQQTGNHPITVHCSAGAGRTGTFIALSNILERVKAEGLLDVFQAVKSLRLQRPHMVQTLEQYEFCYKVVQDFIDIFSDYANFK